MTKLQPLGYSTQNYSLNTTISLQNYAPGATGNKATVSNYSLSAKLHPQNYRQQNYNLKTIADKNTVLIEECVCAFVIVCVLLLI